MGSRYQDLRKQHIAGNPPNTDPQRPHEIFTQYVARMAVQGLPPDIGANESDSDYLARLASYKPFTGGPIGGFIARAYSTIVSNNLTSSVNNCSVTRLATGQYGVAFSNPTSDTNYNVDFNGFVGTNTAPTASLCYVTNATVNNFTMSVVSAVSPNSLTDFVTGSFTVNLD